MVLFSQNVIFCEGVGVFIAGKKGTNTELVNTDTPHTVASALKDIPQV
jgi:hypothetical protein